MCELFQCKYHNKDDVDHLLESLKKALFSINRLVGSKLPPIENRLELQRRLCGYIDARLCEKSA